jgi:hypothetical protein
LPFGRGIFRPNRLNGDYGETIKQAGAACAHQVFLAAATRRSEVSKIDALWIADKVMVPNHGFAFAVQFLQVISSPAGKAVRSRSVLVGM